MNAKTLQNTIDVLANHGDDAETLGAARALMGEVACEERPLGEFLAEVAEGLRKVAPMISGLDGYHQDRLFSLARAFGWHDPEEMTRGMLSVERTVA